ncbi:unnamed protein product [Medioppia subpectinata]|uniref:Glucosylceramidase n=1 Tax=Medioppia subpectinata TaxID=1979941 RepID=A0A7R9Q1H6_9ACAR|nr:unnamed protein product [Medioppia subpectinata]CAG2109213.1 unnamed protein product [Medioppia subpectinata]
MDFLILKIVFIGVVHSREGCVHKDYGNGGTVCVCDESHCDDLEAIHRTDKQVVTVYESSKSGHRLDKSVLNFGQKSVPKANKSVTINVDKSQALYQAIIGFGGAFTDAAGINIKSLPQILQKRLIEDYFGETGIEYTLGRIPIGGSDFSTHAYISVPIEIPLIKEAKAVSKHDIRLIASPWSAPAWMKNNSELNHGGFLIGQPGGKYYNAFANYLVKFLDAYKAQGIPVWGITIENEPEMAIYLGKIRNIKHPFNSMTFTPELQRDFLKLDLGPIMSAAGYGPNVTRVMVCDDQRPFISQWAQVIYGDKEAAQYVSGMAFHWYLNNVSNAVNLDTVHNQDQSKFILSTEACEMWMGKDQHVYLGSWQLFEKYAIDIIMDLNHWTGGWVDWNLALDTRGGPNWVNNFVDAPIIVNATAREYYKQPSFYSIAHFSKFLPPGAQRLNHTLAVDGPTDADTLLTTSFVRTDGGTVVVALNVGDTPIDVTINDVKQRQNITHLLSAHSMQTYIYFDN